MNMNYMGGKFRQGKKIAELVHQVIGPDQWYIEPFCGAMGVATRVQHDKMILSDVSHPLMVMWQHMVNPASELPDVITEDEYNAVKAVRDPNDWRTAYYGFGMSFGSKYFGGYARNKAGTDYAANLQRSMALKRATLIKRIAIDSAALLCMSYDQLPLPGRSFVYCDPPYAGRTKAHNFDTFDHESFWDWVRAKVKEGHVMMITEFIVPDDFSVLHSFGDTVVRHQNSRGKDGTQEVVMCHESQKHLWEK